MHTLRKTAIVGSISLALSPFAIASTAQDYVPGEIYIAGDEVCFQGDLFRAKWWAGPNDVPSDVDTVPEPWDTPWERLQTNVNECGAVDPGNSAPVISVSVSQSPADPSGQTPVDLIVVATDADGDALTYFWSQVANAAPSVSIADADQTIAQVILPQVTQSVAFEFKVTVSDGQEMVTSTVSVTVDPIAGNQAPLASAIATPTTLNGAGDVQLSAIDSSDPDGDILTYQWQQLSPTSPQASINDPTSAQPVVYLVEPNEAVSFVFAVTVSDGELSDVAQVTVSQLVSVDPVACNVWDTNAIYVEGDLVTHNSQKWRAGWWTRGEEPGTTGEWGVWRLVAVDEDCSEAPGPGPNPNPNVVKLSDLLAREAELTSDPLMAIVKASIATLDNTIVAAITPGNTSNPPNVKRVESIIGEQDWEFLFPRRAPEYTYDNFLKAIGKFPAFCGDYDDGRDANAICRKSLATMFAHFTQETGGHTIAWPEPQWRQGLFYLRELGWSEDMPNGYGLCDPSTWQGETWPCAVFPTGHPSAGQFKSYFGRGSKQLSYNYNYGPFSKAMFDDVSVLLEQPNLVADTWLNLASAVFFYVYPQPPKPSMLHALDGTWQPNVQDLANSLTPGFGVTTQIINGGIECGGTNEHIQSQNRIDYYLNFANYLNVPVPAGEVLGCANMQQFDTQGSGALNIHWEQDWSQPNACKLVNYQTRFSAFTDGDYVSCVNFYFDVEVENDI
ncbi:MAG: glycoside hydrolase family 19 protein [Candidatus Competibacteraceae bacterium]|jgi:chitodextrinase|nr:glycoside hydrolase family 19 protein [Candidatus Competibacteraceae bacterium]